VTAPSISSPPSTPIAWRLRAVSPRPHALRALIRRDWLIMRSYRTSFVSDLVFGFLNLVAYYFISRALHPTHPRDLDGAPSYFAFATGGIVLAVVLTSATLGMTRRIREEQLTGTLEMLVAQPVTTAEIALGMAGFPFCFAVGRAFLYLGLAGAFLGLSFEHTSVVGLPVALISSGAAFIAIGVALAAVVLLFKRSEGLAAVLVTGMTLLGGAVFPSRVLPPVLAALSYFAPTRYAFEALRGAQFGATGWVGPCLVLLAFTAIALPLALRLFAFAIRQNTTRGSLNQY
jgi:ABC-2 type transport system permease protein